MAKKEIGDVALLPIRPMYSDAILAGEKRVEFRKTKFRRFVRHIVIYSSYPVKKIVGYFSVKAIKEAGVSALWALYKTDAGIDYDSYRNYYRGRECGVAIEIGTLSVLRTPVTLADIDKNLTAPQSHLYLSNKAFERLSGLPHIP